MGLHPSPHEGRSHRIGALTSLRFFAAMVVVLSHTAFLAFPVSQRFADLSGSGPAARLLALGFTSVSLFFLLSGYILAMAYLSGSSELSYRSFYIARFARIYPLVLLTLIADSPFLLVERIARYGTRIAAIKTFLTFIGSGLLLQAWVPALGGIDFPNWSLSVEAFFYLLFPLLGAKLWKLNHRLGLTALCIWATGQLLVFLASTKLSEDVAAREPLLHLPTFVLGILLARWQFLRSQRSTEFGGIGHATRIILCLVIVAGLSAVVLCLPKLSWVALSDGLLVPVFASLILVLSSAHGWPMKILNAAWLVLLGEASFGLYLIHVPILHVFMSLNLAQRSTYPLYLALCIALSVVSLKLFETPARRWVMKHANPA